MSHRPSGSSTPVPPPVTDIYRPTNAATQRHLAPLLPPGTTPSTRPSLAEILDVDEKTFASRVGGKNILIDAGPPTLGPGPGAGTSGAESKTASGLVVGKKRHRGHPQELLKARREAEYAQAQRETIGAEGLRRTRRKIRDGGGILGRGPVQGITYKSLLPLHHLHLAYLNALLSLPPLPSAPIASSSTPPSSTLPPGLGAEGIQSKLLKADLTGAILLVLASRNPSLVHLDGIVIEETASSFRLISRDDAIRVIPKNGTQFQLSFPAYAPPPMTEHQQAEVSRGEPEPAVDWEQHRKTCPRVQLEILGTAFGYRSADRAGRKFRPAQGGGGGSGWGEEWVRGEWSGVLQAAEEEVAQRSTANIVAEKPEKGKRGKGRKAGSGAGASESGHDTQGNKKRKRGKSRRKDLPAWGRLDVP